jgi:erythromycin esterase
MMVWAHNGHVQTSEPLGGSAPMGMHPRRMFGGAMVTIGFAFNQGEFRASEVGTGRLRTFTAPPAPVDSLDAALTSTGLPLFAVDLRRAPKTGPVAAWLIQEQGSRQIGATYSTELEWNYQISTRITQSFDLLVFVERTSPAVSVAH